MASVDKSECDTCIFSMLVLQNYTYLFMKKQLLLIACCGMVATISASAALTAQLGVLDLTANSGINPATGLAWQAGDTYRLVFVSSTETIADADGFTYYDNYVQNLANNSSITELASVSWQAIVSSGTTSARDHTGTNSLTDGSTTSVWLMNGTEITGNDYNHFWSNRVTSGTQRAIDRTESNAAVPNNVAPGGWDAWRGTWTGTNGDGTINGTGIDGTSPVVGLANAGWSGTSSDDWINRGTGAAATDTYRLYAISEVLTVIPEPTTFSLVGLSGLMLLRRRR